MYSRHKLDQQNRIRAAASNAGGGKGEAEIQDNRNLPLIKQRASWLSNDLSLTSIHTGISSSVGVLQLQFRDQAEIRKSKFIKAAAKMKIAENNASALYDLSEGANKDPVTKLGSPKDKEASQSLAEAFVGGHEEYRGWYAKIKFYNLAGLNAAKGHSGADKAFGELAGLVRKKAESLQGGKSETQVYGYRHEGSRFGFMILGKNLDKSVIQSKFNEAKRDAAKKVRELGLDKVKNPKYSEPDRQGIGIDYHLQKIGPKEKKADTESKHGSKPRSKPEKIKAVKTLEGGFQGKSPGIFKGAAESRESAFYNKADELKLSRRQADKLYKIAERQGKEELTGFDKAGDRLGTVLNAMKYWKAKKPSVFACYIEVDVRNLGGLNDNLTRADSDMVFKYMAQTTDGYVQSLKADVVNFRHGGDEFSFVVVGYLKSVHNEHVRAVLSEASVVIDEFVNRKKIKQEKKSGFDIPLGEGGEIIKLNSGDIPDSFKSPFDNNKIKFDKKGIEIKTRKKDALWSINGPQNFWLISKKKDSFELTCIPQILTLAEILHSKDSDEKPREKGTGIVWGTSVVLDKYVAKEPMSPIDVIAPADQEVESKKK